MEFDENLSKVQGAFMSLHSRGLLNKPESVDAVVSVIKEITNHLHNNSKAKISFFMILNSELSILEELKYDGNLSLFIGAIPAIDRELLPIYIHKSKLWPYLLKPIEECPGIFGLKLYDSIKTYITQTDMESLEDFYKTWRCLFVKIFKIEISLSRDDPKEFITRFSDFYSCIVQKITLAIDSKEIIVVGYHLYYFFKTIYECCKMCTDRNIVNDPIYAMEIENAKKNVNNDLDSMGLILENVLKVVENFDIDMWVQLSEINEGTESLQTKIGCIVHRLLKEFDIPKEMMICLSNLAIDKIVVMASCGLDEVMSRVQNGEREWFEALLKFSSYTDTRYIECLSNNIHFASKEDLNSILQSVYEYLCQKNVKTVELLKKLFLKGLRAGDWWYWMNTVFEELRPDLLTLPDTHDNITLCFNKISKENSIPDWEFVSLCLQSPEETIRKVCQLQQLELKIRLLKLLEPGCKAIHSHRVTLLDQTLLDLLSENLNDKEKQLFVDFVIKAGKNYLWGPLFIEKLLGKMKFCLESGDFEVGLLVLRIVEPALELELWDVDQPSFLVFMSQVLGRFSWSLTSFSHVKAEGREIAGRIVHIVMMISQCYSGAKYPWARLQILESWVLNQAFFCDLWFGSSQTWLGDALFHSSILSLIHTSHKPEVIRKYFVDLEEPLELVSSIILSLYLLLPLITFREWRLIFNQLVIIFQSRNPERKEDVEYEVLDMFGSALHLLTQYLNENYDIHLCHQHCLRHFARLGNEHLLKMNGKSVGKLFEKIFVMVGIIKNEERKKACWDVLSPFLFEAVECLKKKNKSLQVTRKLVGRLLPLLDEENILRAIEKKLEMKTEIDEDILNS